MGKALRDYVTRIIGLGALVATWEGWECLCGHHVCEWCSTPTGPGSFPLVILPHPGTLTGERHG